MIIIGFVSSQSFDDSLGSVLKRETILKFNDSESEEKLILIDEDQFIESRDFQPLCPVGDAHAFVIQHATTSPSERERQIVWLKDNAWRVTKGPSFSHSTQHRFWTDVGELLNLKCTLGKGEEQIVNRITKMYVQAEAFRCLDVYVAYRILARFGFVCKESVYAAQNEVTSIVPEEASNEMTQANDLTTLLAFANKVAQTLLNGAQPTKSDTSRKGFGT